VPSQHLVLRFRLTLRPQVVSLVALVAQITPIRGRSPWASRQVSKKKPRRRETRGFLPVPVERNLRWGDSPSLLL